MLECSKRHTICQFWERLQNSLPDPIQDLPSPSSKLSSSKPSLNLSKTSAVQIVCFFLLYSSWRRPAFPDGTPDWRMLVFPASLPATARRCPNSTRPWRHAVVKLCANCRYVFSSVLSEFFFVFTLYLPGWISAGQQNSATFGWILQQTSTSSQNLEENVKVFFF